MRIDKNDLKAWAYTIGIVIFVAVSTVVCLKACFPKADGMFVFRKYCPQCETRIDLKPGYYMHCPECGHQFFKTHDELSKHLNETQIP